LGVIVITTKAVVWHVSLAAHTNNGTLVLHVVGALKEASAWCTSTGSSYASGWFVTRTAFVYPLGVHQRAIMATTVHAGRYAFMADIALDRIAAFITAI